MVTGHDDAEARLAGLLAGAEEFLTKPVDRSELVLRVRNLLRLKAHTDLAENQAAASKKRSGRVRRTCIVSAWHWIPPATRYSW